MKFEVGQRVIHSDGSIGHVENEYGDNDEFITDVRWVTPNNVESCCVSMCSNEDLTPCLESVVPMQRNKEWWDEAKRFQTAIKLLLLTNKC